MPLPQTKKITDRDDRETTLTALPVRNARAKMGNVNESTAPLSDVPFKPTLRFYLAFVAISSLTLAAAVDATSLSIALPIMTKELGGSAIEAFWAGTSFLITSAILMPIYAALSHIFGRKPVCSFFYLSICQHLASSTYLPLFLCFLVILCFFTLHLFTETKSNVLS